MSLECILGAGCALGNKKFLFLLLYSLFYNQKTKKCFNINYNNNNNNNNNNNIMFSGALGCCLLCFYPDLLPFSAKLNRTCTRLGKNTF